MCGRYAIYTVDDIEDRFDVAVSEDIKPNYNVAPTQVMPVITIGDDGKSKIEMMKWGIPRMLGKDLVKELINTRSDKAFGGFWKKTVANRRCLVPANGFYEWKGVKGDKTPYFIHPAKEDLFAFAGIWDTWKDENGNIINTYSIMTTEPNKEMSTIHNREPVMLHRDEEKLWLETKGEDQDTLEKLLFPYEDGGLEMYEVSKDVNIVRNNNGKLFLPLNSK